MVNKNDMSDNDINDNNKNDIKVLDTSDPFTSSSNFQRTFLNEQEEESSSGSSPSTLKKRLQELPSTARSTDRTSHGHRIYNRDVCHRTDSTKNSVVLNENKEEKNKIISDPDEASSISSSHRSQGARARRRAKIRSEILEEIDKSLAATRTSLNDFLNLIDKTDEERKSTGEPITDSIESLEPGKTDECKDISMLRRRSAFLTDPLSSRSYYRDGEDRERNVVSRQTKSAKESHNSYDCKDKSRLLKNRIELRPLKFGGYRPQTGVILNNLSSDSETDCLHDVNNFVLRKAGSPVVNSELSTPVSNIHKLEGSIKTLPVLSARNDDNQALSSFRSFEETPRSRISVKKCNVINDNVNAFFQNVNPYLEECLNNGDDIRKNDVNSLSSRSTSTIPKSLINEKTKNHKSFDIKFENEARENSYKISDEMVRLLRKENSKSADDLSTLPQRTKEQYPRFCSAKYCSHKENFVSTPRFDGQFSDRISNDYKREKTPSFLNVKLIEDLEAFDASDNEREDNMTKVPILPLNSEDVSRSTSAGSKICSQNRSLDRNFVDTRDKESSLIRSQQKFCYDDEKVEIFKAESLDKISILNRNWHTPISIESRNLHESYDELDVVRQSRRAYSAPCQNLSNENMESMAIDMRRDDSNVTSNLRGYTHDEIRCKSADLSGRDISIKQNFAQLSESSYSSYFARSTGSLSFVEDYQTLSDPLEMSSYSRDEEFNSNAIDYGMSYMYPRQSHLSVLQEESETRFEENGRSDAIIENKDSNGKTVNEIDEHDKASTISSKDRTAVECNRIESKSIEREDRIEDNKSDNDINEDSDNSTKNDSLSSTQESQTNSTSLSSRSETSESNDEDDRIRDAHEEGDHEFQSDKSYVETIGANECCSKTVYDKSNGPESTALENQWQVNDGDPTLQYLTSVQPEIAKLTVEKVHDISAVSKTSCSTSRLHCASERTKHSPRFRNKKSQDRFPFTISETKSMISTSNKKQGHCENVNNKTRSLETFKSLTGPVFEEFLKTPNETVDCFNFHQRQEQRNIVPKVKGLVRKFSKKFKISRKRTELDMDDPTTRVIYQNQECQVDSMPDSCSDDSSIKDSKWATSRSAKTRSSIISSGRSLKKANSLENLTMCKEYPRRRYDRDDLWVKELQKCLPKRDSARTSSKERPMLSSSRSSGSSLLEDSKRSPEKNERTSCKKEDRIKILESCSVLPSNVIENKAEFKKKRNQDVDESSDDAESGCVCLQIFRTISCSLCVRSHDGSSIESRKRSKR